MAVAQEQLLIDVVVDDKLTPAMREMSAETKKFGQDVKASAGRATESLKKTSEISTTLAAKFRALSKAAVGIFTADLAARVFGFRSALEALSQASDHVAQGFQALLAGVSTAELDRRARGVKAITDAMADLAARESFGKFTIGGQGLRRQFDLSRYAAEGADVYQATVDVLARYQRMIDGLTANNLFGVATESDRERIQQLFDSAPALIDAAAQSARSAKRDALALAEAAESAAEAQERWNSAAKGGGAVAALQIRIASQIGARIVGLTGQRFAAGIGLGPPSIAMRLRREHGELAPTGGVLRRQAGGAEGTAAFGAQAMLVGIRVAALEVQRMTTFVGQAQAAFGALSKTIRQGLAANVVGVAFDSFRGFFRDVITGAKDAKAAFRDFALNVVAGMADIFAQQLALRAVSGVSAAFGFPLTAQAHGGYARGGYRLDSYAAGGVVRGPRPVMLGDNASRHEAVVPLPGAGRAIPVEFVGGGGRAQNVVVQLSVTSLDPRGAADVVLSAMPQIQRALVGALGGTDRALISAVRSA